MDLVPVFVVVAVVVVAFGVVAAALLRWFGRRLSRQLADGQASTVESAVTAATSVVGDKLTDQMAAGSRELDLRGRAFDQKVADLSGELHRLGEAVSSMRTERAEQHGQLVAGLEDATRSNEALASHTRSLSDALASPKARGQWGERLADDVLRMAGFVEGVNYRKQSATDVGTVPDFTFLLPHDQVLHMDVKFPVDNYRRYLEADSDGERDTLRTAFLRDVKNKVKDLTSRDYADPASTVGYVLMFIPNESVYGFVHEHDAAIGDQALGQRVLLCSPYTLFAVLAVIRQALDCFALERASDEILESLAGFTTQWDKFSDHLDTVGKRLDSAHKAFEELAGVRRRQLQRSVDHLDDIRSQSGLPAPDAEVDAEVDLREDDEVPRLHSLPAG